MTEVLFPAEAGSPKSHYTEVTALAELEQLVTVTVGVAKVAVRQVSETVKGAGAFLKYQDTKFGSPK